MGEIEAKNRVLILMLQDHLALCQSGKAVPTEKDLQFLGEIHHLIEEFNKIYD